MELQIISVDWSYRNRRSELLYEDDTTAAHRSGYACRNNTHRLLLLQVYADDTPQPKQVLDPAVAVGAATAGVTAGAALAASSGGALKPQITQAIVSNGVVAADSAGKALGNAGAAIGSLIGGHKLAALHQGLAGAKGNGVQALLNLIRAINSLGIAATNVGVGAADALVSGLINSLRGEAQNLGTLYLGLLGEFGRTVGAGLNVMETLATGSAGALFNPIRLGVGALDHGVSALIKFLQGLADASVASPDKALLLTPFIGTLQSVRLLLNALRDLLKGPQGGLVNAVQGAANVAGDILGGPAGGPAAGAVGGLVDGIQKALDLLNPLLAHVGR
eukprot:gene8915-9092_t